MSSRSKLSKYQKIEKYLISIIAENDFPPGTLLPSEPALCKRFRVSRNTVRQAIGNLINRGLIYNEHGKGTFVANPQDKTRSSTTHKEIGIVLNDVDQIKHPFFSEYLRGIQEELDLHQSSIHLIFSHPSSSGEMELSREKDVLGLILISHDINDDYILSLQATRIPFVWFSSYKTNKRVPYIYLDKKQGIYLAVEHLVKLGHRKIAYIAGNPGEKRDYEEKLDGFHTAMKEFQIPIHKNWILNGYYTREGAEIAAQVIFCLENTPTAVIAANDIMAISIVNTLKSMGKKVPVDVSIVGFDDILESSNIRPPLTTVHVPMMKMGREAVKILFSMIEKEDTTIIYQVNVEPELRIRGTTSPLGKKEK